MKQGDLKKFAVCVEAMRGEFTPNEQLSKLQLDVKFKALMDIPIEDIERATWTIISTRKTASFPKVAEIREAATGSLEDKSVIAYDAFTKGKAATGAYDSVSFHDKTIHAVIMAMGGWQEICIITEEEWKFKRREFIDLYKAITRNPGRDIPEKLIGLGEHGCSQNDEWTKYMPDLKLISQFGEIIEVRKQLPGSDRKQIENPALKLVKGIGG
jgi:hypothetical protein